MNNPCALDKDVVVPSGTIIHYNLDPGDVEIPAGWKLHTRFGRIVMPDGDDDEGVNPYQPDLHRLVMLEKL